MIRVATLNPTDQLRGDSVPSGTLKALELITPAPVVPGRTDVDLEVDYTTHLADPTYSREQGRGETQ